MEGNKQNEIRRRGSLKRQAMVLVLLVVAAAGLLSWFAVTTPTAWAERQYPEKGGRPILPDSGAQRLAIIKQLKLVNTKLEQLNKTLTSGKVKVIAVPEEAKPGVPTNVQDRK